METERKEGKRTLKSKLVEALVFTAFGFTTAIGLTKAVEYDFRNYQGSLAQPWLFQDSVRTMLYDAIKY